MVAARPTRPVLRYHGGKWRLAEWIISHFPPHRIYVEPFGGGGSILLKKARVPGEVYNDLDGEIVNLFRVLRDPAQSRELARLCALTPFARAEFEGAGLPASDPIDAARKLLVKSYMGFSPAAAMPSHSVQRTGFRATGHRRNGGACAMDWANYGQVIPAFTERLRGVTIENRPAFEVIKQQDSAQTLLYLDPPYPHSTRSNLYQTAYRFEMTDGEHRELAELLHTVKGMVVLSGYECDLYDRELYADWRKQTRAALADGARKRVECLWISPNAQKAITQQRMSFD